MPSCTPIKPREFNSVPCMNDCQHCGLRRICLRKVLLGGNLSGIRDLLERQYPVHAQDVLYRQGEDRHCLYVIKAGSFKLMDVRSDGQQQINAFVYPGQLLGLEDMDQNSHTSTAIALEESRVGEINLEKFFRRCRSDPETMIELMLCMSQLIRLQRDRLYQQSHCDAMTRVAQWLIQHSEHLRVLDRDGRRFRLSMERRDLAAYLGLTLETVSRSLSALQSNHCITVKGRHIECRQNLFQRYKPSMDVALDVG